MRFANIGNELPASDIASGQLRPGPGTGQYAELIKRHFVGYTVVAIIGAGSGEGVSAMCEELAADIAGQGRRIALVSVRSMLEQPLIDYTDTALSSYGAPGQVCHWPPPDLSMNLARVPGGIFASAKWLTSLRVRFDSVLLDCPALSGALGSAEIAAMADTAILAVDGDNTPIHQIVMDQRTLKLSGVKLETCVLMTSAG